MTKHLVDLLKVEPPKTINDLEDELTLKVRNESLQTFEQAGEHGKQMHVEVSKRGWGIPSYCIRKG